jgi:hypothetical protein
MCMVLTRTCVGCKQAWKDVTSPDSTLLDGRASRRDMCASNDRESWLVVARRLGRTGRDAAAREDVSAVRGHGARCAEHRRLLS